MVDVVYLSSSCNQCTAMEEKRDSGKITRRELVEWYLHHDENCFMNHDRSMAVRILLMLFHIIRSCI